MRPVALLTLWQARNWIRTTFTNPRKLIPAIILLAYLGMNLFFVGVGSVARRQARPPAELTTALRDHLPLVDAVLFGLLILVALGVLDSGFREGFLTFSLADIDYLFTSPISRRSVLAYRVAARTMQSFFQYAFIVFMLLYFGLRSFLPVEAGIGVFLVMVSALFFCVGGYTNLAFALKMVLDFGRGAVARRWYLGLALAAAALLGVVAWREGLPQLRTLLQSWLVVVPFFPCRLAASALLAPFTGASAAPALAGLAGFYLAAGALLISRKENYYEATLAGSERLAKLRTAARERNWGAIFALRHAERTRGSRKPGKPFTIRPWGRGGGALVWANLAAAAKRPWMNWYLPLLAGQIQIGRAHV